MNLISPYGHGPLFWMAFVALCIGAYTLGMCLRAVYEDWRKQSHWQSYLRR